MSKIGIYTDAHFSISSSIMNRISGYRYSERLDYLIDSFKFMYEEFKNNKVTTIVNCGDLTDSDLLHAEENTALYEALSYNPGIPEYYILGNHEIKSKDSKLSSVSILNGYNNINLYSEIRLIESDTENVTLVMVPYDPDTDSYDKLYKMLDEIPQDQKVYIFSHMSYIGENYNNYVVTEGLDKVRLTTMYPNVKGIFNGHIHNAKDDGIYHQIGSIMGSSFGDSYSGALPGIIILDTEEESIKRIPNPYAVLFYKTSCSSLKDVGKYLKGLNSDNKICLRVEVPASIKDETYDFIEQYKDKYNILEYRIKAKYEKNSNTESEESRIELSHYRSPYEALSGFLDTQDSLPYEKTDMVKFLDTYIGG